MKDSLNLRKSSGSSQALVLHKKPLKKGSLENNLKVGRKLDQVKVKLMGETLVEFRLEKTIGSHFSHSHK